MTGLWLEVSDGKHTCYYTIARSHIGLDILARFSEAMAETGCGSVSRLSSVINPGAMTRPDILIQGVRVSAVMSGTHNVRRTGVVILSFCHRKEVGLSVGAAIDDNVDSGSIHRTFRQSVPVHFRSRCTGRCR